jgi:hypothetical protein
VVGWRWRVPVGGAVALLTFVVVACGGEEEEAAVPTPTTAQGVVATVRAATATVAPRPSSTAAPTQTPALPPTATASPVPAAETGDMEGFRAFAVQIAAAVREKNVQFFSGRARFEQVTCPPEPPGELVACADEPPGTVVQVLSHISYPFEGAGVSREQFESSLEQWFAGAKPDLSDQYGSGALVLYALANSPAPGITGQGAHAIVSGIVDWLPDLPPPAERGVLFLTWQFLEGRWQVTSYGSADRPEYIPDWLTGQCAKCYDYWERWEGNP